jgi:molecular chaperone GrpE
MFKKSNEEKESKKDSKNLQDDSQQKNRSTEEDAPQEDGALEVEVEEGESTDEKEGVLRSPEEIQEAQQERIRELKLALKKEQQEALQHLDALKRQQAEFVNYKKRMDRERDKDRKFATKQFALDLLQVVDNLERALDAEETKESAEIYKGVELVLKQFKDVLKKNSIEEEFPLHEPYDMDFHEVILKEESDEHEADTVIEVLQKGYKLHGKILRPAMVKIAK